MLILCQFCTHTHSYFITFFIINITQRSMFIISLPYSKPCNNFNIILLKFYEILDKIYIKHKYISYVIRNNYKLCINIKKSLIILDYIFLILVKTEFRTICRNTICVQQV